MFWALLGTLTLCIPEILYLLGDQIAPQIAQRAKAALRQVRG